MANPTEEQCEGMDMAELGAEMKPVDATVEKQLAEELKRALEQGLAQ